MTARAIIKPEQPDMDRALVKEIAFDIGKEAVAHLHNMYPKAHEALGKSGQLSLRNCIHNEIMAALETIDADEMRQRLDARKKARRETKAMFKNMRFSTKPMQENDDE